jgi:ubiquinone/menaquinone biosynthesis C-methylase UbiE
VTDSSAIANCCDFAGSYDLSRLPEIKKLEQAALGCDYGGTSWTTREQVDAILNSLQLGESNQLLDIGSGAGWPGLLLGKMSNCHVTLLDIPLNALSQAAERAAADGMTDRVKIIAGSGTSLPFDDAIFDRVSHSDVLCCLPQKFEFLKEARRVAVPDARMHFSVILPAEDLSASDHALVLETGPPFIGLDSDYSEMLRDTGWRVEELQDVTDEYGNSLQRLVDGISDNEAELKNLLGAEDLVAKREHREDQIGLIRRGLMRREAYVATAT